MAGKIVFVLLVIGLLVMFGLPFLGDVTESTDRMTEMRDVKEHYQQLGERLEERMSFCMEEQDRMLDCAGRGAMPDGSPCPRDWDFQACLQGR